jgi:methyltransferase (TIGR00027 family)
MSIPNILVSIVLWIIKIILLPFTIVGYLIFIGKLLKFSGRSRASTTVLASFYTRWMQHKLGTRQDQPCARLMMSLPNISQPGLRLITGPTLLVHQLTGFVPRIYRYPYEGIPPFKHQPAARTTFFDTALERHLASIDQLVILGAGLDTRSYRLDTEIRPQCFEVDTPKTQQFKREMLEKAHLEASHVTFVPADFENEDWFEKLVDAGFKPNKPSFFLWESVTMYLEREAVESTLRKIATTAPGSVIAFDYLSSQYIDQRTIYMRYIRAWLSAIGEPWKFGLDNAPPARDQLAVFLQSCGLSLEEHRTFGQETNRKRAEAGFATAIVKIYR